MPTFSLFRKKRKQTQHQVQQTSAVEQATVEDQPPTITKERKAINTETTPMARSSTRVQEQHKTDQTITYLKAMPLHELADLETVKNEVKNGNIIILRITPLASKSIEDVKQAVDQLYSFAESIHGDIARLGEERIVICPDKICIWREKTTKTEDSKEPQKEQPETAQPPTAA
ncbi:MAG TPA: cell division protein SepF [Candidatus Sulfotelmatobacter sp.]|nr:cell division protein SepF [Candidatus Sulfotelmatobacter sp.]